MDATKKLAQAAKTLKRTVGAGWLACAAFVLSGVVLLYHSSGPEGVWLRRVLGEVPPIGWLLAVVALAALLTVLIWRARSRSRRKEARAAGRQLGMTALEPVSPSSLVDVWNEFRAGFRLAVRREVDRFPVVVVLGGAGAATDDVLRAYAGSDERAAETLRAVVPGSYMNVHLGADVVVQELSSALLDEQRGDVGTALRKLWRKSFRRLFGLLPAAVAAPVVALAVDPSRLARMSSAEVRSAAVAVRGKLNLLSDICRQPVEVRLLLVQLSELPGYAKYVQLVQQAGVQTEVSLSGLLPGEQLETELCARLSQFGDAVQLSLTLQTTHDFAETLAFFQALPALGTSLALFVRELIKDIRMSDTPELSTLALTHTATCPSRFPANPLRPGGRPEAAPRGYLLWPHRWLTSAAAVAALSYATVGFVVERAHFRGALTALAAYPSGPCGAQWRAREFAAREAVRDFVHPYQSIESPLRALPFFSSARQPIAHKEAILFRDRLLMAVTAERTARADVVSQVHGLFLLGLLHAPGQPELRQLALGEDLPEFVSHTPFDADSLRQYLEVAPPPDLAGFTLDVPGVQTNADDDRGFRDWVAALNRAIGSDPAVDASGLRRLKEDAAVLATQYKQLLAWAGEHWLAYDVLDRLEDGQPTDHYRATLPLSMPRTVDLTSLVRDRVPLLKLVAGTDLPPAQPQARSLSTLIETVWTLICNAGAPDDVRASACKNADERDTAHKKTADLVEIPAVEGDTLTRGGHVYTSEDYKRLIRDVYLLGEVQAFAAAVSQLLGDAAQGEGAAPLPPRARALMSLTLDDSEPSASYFDELAPLLRETEALLLELKSDALANQLLHASVEKLVDAYGTGLYARLADDATQVAESFPDAGERALSARTTAAMRAYGPLLRVVERAQEISDIAADAAQAERGSGLFATLAAALSDLRSKSKLFDNDAPTPALGEYATLLGELSQALAAGEGAPAAERLRVAEAAGISPELSSLFSPAAQLAVPMLSGASDALDVRLASWQAANEPAPALLDMLEAPFRALRRLGQRRLEAVGRAIWEVRMHPKLAELTRAFPFSRSGADVDPKALSDALVPGTGTLSKDYTTYVVPLAALGRTLVPAALERSWRRVQTLQTLLWSDDGKPKPYLVKLTPQPFDTASRLVRVELRSGDVSALPYVNQDPVASALPIDWTEQHDAEIAVTSRADGDSRRTEFGTTPRSYWALLHLLSQLPLTQSGRDACVVRWSPPGAGKDAAGVALRVSGAPFVPFALLIDTPPGACEFARGAR